MEDEDTKTSLKAAVRKGVCNGADHLSSQDLARLLELISPNPQQGSCQELAEVAFESCQTTKNGTVAWDDLVDWLFSPSAGSKMQHETARVNELTADPALRPHWLPKVGKGNRDTPPTFWAMTLKQWHLFMAACRLCPKYAEVKRTKTHVTLYDLDKHFVRPWTRKTGNSVALLMNHEQPIDAKLMISHAWGEDVDECAIALRSFCVKDEVPESTACWFCIFAQYQPGSEPGDCGPTVQEQLAQDPFQCVISHPGLSAGMVVISTSTAELYERLWCVLEIACAQEQGLCTKAALSWLYGASTWEQMRKEQIPFSAWAKIDDMDTFGSLMSVDTQNAKCSNVADAKMIVETVSKTFDSLARSKHYETAFAYLDAKITMFRLEVFEDTLKGFREVFSPEITGIQRVDDATLEWFIANDSLSRREMPNPLPTSSSVRDLLKQEAQGVILLSKNVVNALSGDDNGDNTDSEFEDDDDLNGFYKIIAGLYKQRARVSRTCLNLYHAELLAESELDPNVGMEAATKQEECFWRLEGSSALEPALESFDAEALHVATRGVRRKRQVP